MKHNIMVHNLKRQHLPTTHQKIKKLILICTQAWRIEAEINLHNLLVQNAKIGALILFFGSFHPGHRQPWGLLTAPEQCVETFITKSE